MKSDEEILELVYAAQKALTRVSCSIQARVDNAYVDETSRRLDAAGIPQDVPVHTLTPTQRQIAMRIVYR